MTDLYSIANSSIGKVTDCGTLVSSFNSQVSFTVKITSISLLILVIFEWWAINRVMNGRLTHEDKQKYISFIMVFCQSLIVLGSFVLFYWIVLSGIDF